GFEAAVSAACLVPESGAPQVCSERVLLSTGRPGLERLPGTVLPLLEPDVPATLWWDLPDPPAGRLVSDLVRAFDRVLLDLTTAAAPAAIWEAFRDAGPATSDLAWFRAGSWREAIAQLFDGAGAEVLAAVDSIEVTTAAEAEQLLPAALLGGWAASQLGWRPKKGSGYFSATDWLRPGGGAGRITIRVEAVGEGRPGRLQAVHLQAGDDGEWTLTRAAERPRELLLQAHHQDWCRIPSRLPAPRPDPAGALLAAITAPPRNAVRDRALRRAVWMLGWAGAEE
ncbi:MAG: glucose-6-phosphate dehydrogenase assembly protein OpcA, partial [Armatimonadetes bacterium]|nr:glucose-6-phosphate dehydrogenase assembly protein OpcA [Armatimonadota bacterium]